MMVLLDWLHPRACIAPGWQQSCQAPSSSPLPGPHPGCRPPSPSPCAPQNLAKQIGLILSSSHKSIGYSPLGGTNLHWSGRSSLGTGAEHWWGHPASNTSGNGGNRQDSPAGSTKSAPLAGDDDEVDTQNPSYGQFSGSLFRTMSGMESKSSSSLQQQAVTSRASQFSVQAVSQFSLQANKLAALPEGEGEPIIERVYTPPPALVAARAVRDGLWDQQQQRQEQREQQEDVHGGWVRAGRGLGLGGCGCWG